MINKTPEFDGLINSGRKRLDDAQNKSDSLESRFDLADNAAHALCLAYVFVGHPPPTNYPLSPV